MKCAEVKDFFSDISSRASSIPSVGAGDLDLLSKTGFVSVMSKDDYEKAAAEVAQLAQLNEDLQKEQAQESAAASALQKDESEEHSLKFHFEAKDSQDAERQKVESDQAEAQQEQAKVAQIEAKVSAFIARKSFLDTYVPYGDGYIALTAQGVTALSDLNVKNYRVADADFADFMKETLAITADFATMASRGKYYVDQLRNVPDINVPEQHSQGDSGSKEKWDSS